MGALWPHQKHRENSSSQFLGFFFPFGSWEYCCTTFQHLVPQARRRFSFLWFSSSLLWSFLFGFVLFFCLEAYIFFSLTLELRNFIRQCLSRVFVLFFFSLFFSPLLGTQWPPFSPLGIKMYDTLSLIVFLLFISSSPIGIPISQESVLLSSYSCI